MLKVTSDLFICCLQVREHKHVILCGPPTTGKSTTALKLANIISQGSESSIQRFSLTRDNSQGVASFIESAQSGGRCDIVIIDNLQNAHNVDTLLQNLSSTNINQVPYIIGEIFLVGRISINNISLQAP